jgi:uncharacterized protein (TIGR02145 family)
MIQSQLPNSTYHLVVRGIKFNRNLARAYSKTILGLAIALMISSCSKEENLPLVRTIGATDISRHSAIVHGEVIDDRGSFIREKGICFSVDNPEPTIENSRTREGTDAGEFASVFGGLDAGTLFYIRAYATSQQGTGYGNILTFRTLEIPGQVSSIVDERDGKTYQTRVYGNAIWFTDNLSYLPEINQPSVTATAPRYYVYDYWGVNPLDARQTQAFNTHGVLYNWTAASGACPPGWRLPNLQDWKDLIAFFGDENAAGGRLKSNDPQTWDFPNEAANNESGFRALPSGKMLTDELIFKQLGSHAYFWVADEYEPDRSYAHAYKLRYNSGAIMDTVNIKSDGFCVRCIKE